MDTVWRSLVAASLCATCTEVGALFYPLPVYVEMARFYYLLGMWDIAAVGNLLWLVSVRYYILQLLLLLFPGALFVSSSSWGVENYKGQFYSQIKCHQMRPVHALTLKAFKGQVVMKINII